MTFGDASPSIARTYTPDGLPLTLTFERRRLGTQLQQAPPQHA